MTLAVFASPELVQPVQLTSRICFFPKVSISSVFRLYSRNSRALLPTLCHLTLVHQQGRNGLEGWNFCVS